MRIVCAVIGCDFNFGEIGAPETICLRCGYPWKAYMKQREKEQLKPRLTRRVLTRETWYIGVILWTVWWIAASLFKGESDQWALGSLMATIWFPMVCDKSSEGKRTE